jgi:hypothetical protein
MTGEGRRQFSLSLFDDKGQIFDRHAVAHDVTPKGLRIESQAELEKGQFVRFALSLDDAGGELKGRARVAWREKTALSCWAGVEFVGMSWRGKRRIRRAVTPARGGVDWSALADKLAVALLLLSATAIGWRMLASPEWRSVLPGLIPAAIAALAMGWALKQLLS